MVTRVFTAWLHKEGDGWVALCPELDVASQGDSMEQARANLQEAVGLFIETASQSEIDHRLHGETRLMPLEVRVG